MAVVIFHMSLFIVTYIIFLAINSLCCMKVDKYSFLMPNVKPYMNELYLCSPIRVNYTKNYYIVGFEPNATMDTAHHMLLYGCTEPGSSKPVWNCGEMAYTETNEETASPCAQGSQIIYAWARDAPKLELPEGVGFKVGGDSSIQYLVLQVHYAHTEKFSDGSTDDSGVFLHYTERPMEKLAGVILLGTAGAIPPMAVEHMETACQIKENKTIIPFAFRTHAHRLGKLIAGYVVKSDANGENEWILLGKKDPLLPEMFYSTVTNTPIQKNDFLAARCTMESDRHRFTYIGYMTINTRAIYFVSAEGNNFQSAPLRYQKNVTVFPSPWINGLRQCGHFVNSATNNDEMCNFYLMYYVNAGEPLKQKYCFSTGPPNYYWKKSEHFNNIPDKEASSPN